MDETTYYAARKMRWDRVYVSGSNDGESVAAANACGGTMGTTTEGYASAGPRRQMRIAVRELARVLESRTQSYNVQACSRQLLCW